MEPCIYPCIDSRSWRIVGHWLIMISASILIRTSIWISSTKIFSALMFCHLRINSRPQKSQLLVVLPMQWANYKYIHYLTLNLKLGTFYWQQLVSWYPLCKLHAPVITQVVIQVRVPNKVGGKLIPFIAFKRVG